MFLIIILFLFLTCKNKIELPENPKPSPQNTAKVKVEKKYRVFIKRIRPFFQVMGKPEPGEWLSSFEEDGQTFEEYINSSPTLPTTKRKIIYIQPLGQISPKQRSIIKKTRDFLEIFYNLRVKILKTRKFPNPVPLLYYRIHPVSKTKQIKTGYILDKLLYPNLPTDAAAMISFTNEDLFPDKNYNYVFGQASLEKRVGVWSFSRLEKNAKFNLLLKRALKIAIHETGHMFSIHHCIKYSCAMSGTNHIMESDKRPLDFCPEDTAKILWMNKPNFKKRYLMLKEFCLKNGLEKEANLFNEKAVAISE